MLFGATARSESAIVPLYRIENPDKEPTRPPDGSTSHEELVGQWFSPNLLTALVYLRKSTQTFGKDAHPVDGTRLIVAQVPADRLEDYHVTKHPIASTMDVEGDNYILPLDGSFSTEVLPLDETLGDLRGKLGNVANQQEAARRVKALVEHAGLIAIAEPRTT
jgi:hypothetical protein